MTTAVEPTLKQATFVVKRKDNTGFLCYFDGNQQWVKLNRILDKEVEERLKEKITNLKKGQKIKLLLAKSGNYFYVNNIYDEDETTEEVIEEDIEEREKERRIPHLDDEVIEEYLQNEEARDRESRIPVSSIIDRYRKEITDARVQVSIMDNAINRAVELLVSSDYSVESAPTSLLSMIIRNTKNSEQAKNIVIESVKELSKKLYKFQIVDALNIIKEAIGELEQKIQDENMNSTDDNGDEGEYNG